MVLGGRDPLAPLLSLLPLLGCLQVIHCIENGLPLLIENLPEEIDPVLDAVIQKKVGMGVGGQRCRLHCTALQHMG